VTKPILRSIESVKWEAIQLEGISTHYALLRLKCVPQHLFWLFRNRNILGCTGPIRTSSRADSSSNNNITKGQNTAKGATNRTHPKAGALAIILSTLVAAAGFFSGGQPICFIPTLSLERLTPAEPVNLFSTRRQTGEAEIYMHNRNDLI